MTATTAGDLVLDQALDRIRELSSRLHAVRELHSGRRRLLGAPVCRCCGRAFPCPTARAAQAGSTSHRQP